MAKRSRKRAPSVKPTAGRNVGAPKKLLGALPGWALGSILFLAVILTYLPVWQAQYIWDDDRLLTANPCIIGPLGFQEIWTTSMVKFCPMVLTAFWVEHAWWDLAPQPYHVVNVLLHAANALVLWRILRLLKVPGAWLGAALWALHPVQAESVAWIAEMKNTQSGLFFLLSILLFVKGLIEREGMSRAKRNWNDALTVLSAVLAMTSKPSTVILPLVLGLCAWWMEKPVARRDLIKLASIFLVSLMAGALTIWTPDPDLATDTQLAQPWPERLAAAGDAVWFYLGKLLWPHPLVMVYPRWQIDARAWTSYLPLLAAIVLLLILWLKRKSSVRTYFFVYAYFLIALLPVLGLVDMLYLRFSLVADHFQYLASMGPLALIGAGLTRLGEFAAPGKAWLQASLCAALLLLLGVLSWEHSRVFENQETVWSDTLSKNPSCWVARNNLGIVLVQKGQLDEATAQFQKALATYPKDIQAYNDLGTILLQRGDLDAAVIQFQNALQIKPTFAEAHYNLGNVYFQKEQFDQAVAQFAKAVAIKPDYAEAHNNLGLALEHQGRVDDAIVQFQAAIKLKLNYTVAQNNLAAAQAMAHPAH